jgi:hypothetical protein
MTEFDGQLRCSVLKITNYVGGIHVGLWGLCSSSFYWKYSASMPYHQAHRNEINAQVEQLITIIRISIVKQTCSK